MTTVGDKTSAAFSVLRPNRTVLPLIAVGGSRGKSTVASMLSRIVQAAGRSVASWISTGVYVDGEQMEGELRPWSRVLLAAKYGELDAVIQELEAAVVVGAGLPSRTYPLAILTTICGNDDSCRLSMSTELEERSLQAIADAVRDDGCIIANADDLSVVASVQSVESQVIMFALHPDNPVLQRHLEGGNQAVWVENGKILCGTSSHADEVATIATIPATLDGSLIFQVQNAMAATAAALHLGIDPTVIASSLATFQPDVMMQPGACNVLSLNRGQVVIDSPMQTWTLKMLARGIKHQPHRRSIVVSSCFPELHKDEAREVGRILGGLGGVVLLHHDTDDRKNVDALKAGIASNSVPPLVAVLGSEPAAIEQLKATLGAGDTALVLSQNPEQAIELLSA
jgi:cyanophycin synthetase